mmetsp:Transcript_124073/g.397019  ORF Transcript_124073/g.397019 Transcript_124073/m.397019 type:complete len:197 (-) Transcript_124073:4-594(-)
MMGAEETQELYAVRCRRRCRTSPPASGLRPVHGGPRAGSCRQQVRSGPPVHRCRYGHANVDFGRRLHAQVLRVVRLGPEAPRLRSGDHGHQCDKSGLMGRAPTRSGGLPRPCLLASLVLLSSSFLYRSCVVHFAFDGADWLIVLPLQIARPVHSSSEIRRLSLQPRRWKNMIFPSLKVVLDAFVKRWRLTGSLHLH